MSRVTRVVPFLLLALAAASCATPTKLDAVWRDPTSSAGPAKSILVVGVGTNERHIKVYESGMARPLQARKLTVLYGTQVLGVQIPDSVTAVAKIKASGADLLMLTRLLGVDNEQQYVPGSTYVSPGMGYGGYYGGYGGYYSSSYMMVSNPGYVVNYKVVRIETNVYDIRTGKMVWSGASSTSDPADADDLMASFSNAIIGDMVQHKLLP